MSRHHPPLPRRHTPTDVVGDVAARASSPRRRARRCSRGAARRARTAATECAPLTSDPNARPSSPTPLLLSVPTAPMLVRGPLPAAHLCRQHPLKWRQPRSPPAAAAEPRVARVARRPPAVERVAAGAAGERVAADALLARRRARARGGRRRGGRRRGGGGRGRGRRGRHGRRPQRRGLQHGQVRRRRWRRDEFIAMVRDLVAAQQEADAPAALDDHKIARTFASLDFDASRDRKRELQGARTRRRRQTRRPRRRRPPRASAAASPAASAAARSSSRPSPETAGRSSWEGERAGLR